MITTRAERSYGALPDRERERVREALAAIAAGDRIGWKKLGPRQAALVGASTVWATRAGRERRLWFDAFAPGGPRAPDAPPLRLQLLEVVDRRNHRYYGDERGGGF
jgi:hypothetical protein